MIRALARAAGLSVAAWAGTAELVWIAAQHPHLDSLWVLGIVALSGYLLAGHLAVGASETTGEDT